MKIELIAKSAYGFFGTVFLIAGATVMLFHTGLLPASIENILMDFANRDPNALHLIQEFGSLLVFAGLISIWFVRHYQKSKVYHWAMTTFWALFALAHWFDGGDSPRSIGGLLINTIPFMMFLLIGLFRLSSERQFAGEASK